MLAAKPLDAAVPGSNRAAPVGEPVAAANGPAGAMAGAAGPGATAAIPVVPDVVDATGGIDAATFPGGVAYSYPPPFTRYFVPAFMRSQYPFRTVGKLFFKQYGSSFVCSASVIGRTHLLTAGHCVHKGDNKATGWSTNVVFCPAYNSGACPYGQWTAKTLLTSTEWFQKGNPGGFWRDWGGIVANPLNGVLVGNRVGWLGRAWNQGTKQHFNDFGYPQGAPFNGTTMTTCQASTNRTDTAIPAPVDPIAIGCDMTGGSSGGPWILRHLPGSAGANNYANGVNSYKYNNDARQMYSPYADTFFKTITDNLLARS